MKSSFYRLQRSKPAGFQAAGFLFLMVLSFALVACRGSARRSELPPVPSTALLWVYIDDPRAAFFGLNAFWKESGLEQNSGKSLTESISEKNAGQRQVLDTMLAEVNASHPVVFAYLPNPENTAAPQSVVYLNMREGQKSLDRIRQTFPDSAEHPERFALIGSWAVIAFEGAAPTLAPAESLERPRTAITDTATIVAGIEVANALSNWQSEVFSFFEQIRASIKSAQTDVNTITTLRNTLAIVESSLSDFSRVEFSFLAASDGLLFSTQAFNVDGSRSSRVGAELAGKAPALSYWNKLDNNALLALSWSFDNEALFRYTSAWYNLPGSEGMLGADYRRYGEEVSRAAGYIGAASFDISIAPDLQAKMAGVSDPRAVESILDKAIQVDYKTWSLPRDISAYRAALAWSAGADLYGPAFDQILSEAGFALRMFYNTATLEGHEYDTLGWRLRLGERYTQGSDQKKTLSMQALADRLMAKLDMTIWPEGFDLYTSTGGPYKARSLASGWQSEQSADNSTGWRRLRESVPPSARLAAKFSTRRLFELIRPWAGLNEEQLAGTVFDGLYFWLSFDAEAFGAGYYLPIADFQSFMKLGGSSFSQHLK